MKQVGSALLDLTALVSASRGVVKKHIALRARQWDYYRQGPRPAGFRDVGQREGSSGDPDPRSPGSDSQGASRTAWETSAPLSESVSTKFSEEVTHQPPKDSALHWDPASQILAELTKRDEARQKRVEPPDGGLDGDHVAATTPEEPRKSQQEVLVEGRSQTRKSSHESSVEGQLQTQKLPEEASVKGLQLQNPSQGVLVEGRLQPQKSSQEVSVEGRLHSETSSESVSVEGRLQSQKSSEEVSVEGQLQPQKSSEDVSVGRLQPQKSSEEASVEGRLQPQKSPEEVSKGRLAAEISEDAPVSKSRLGVDHSEVERKPAATAAAQTAAAQEQAYVLRESRVPSSRLSRLWNYGGLAAGMLAGAVGETVSRTTGGGSSTNSTSVFLSAANTERLVSRLSRMRGAALKLGQMLSFQDAKLLPQPLHDVLQRVQDRADYMPRWQRDAVLAANLGEDWRDRLFEEFDDLPIAAASIGQVHRAVLKPTEATGGKAVKAAVKVQFPGVAKSINSDLDNLSMLLAASRMLPRGLYLDRTIANARVELAWECDYVREADCADRYRELLAGDDAFVVPRVYRDACGPQVLTMEFMEGEGVTKRRVASPGKEPRAHLDQAQRDWIGTQVLRLCLREMVEFRFMQTDPNWSNFLYNNGSSNSSSGARNTSTTADNTTTSTSRLELLDFGASREFPARFVEGYVRLLAAASRADREAVRELSQVLGYLTGHESRAMVDAHVESVLTLAEPFVASRTAQEPYDFSEQTITDRIKGLIPVMVRERLTPPPEETYSLHRKLSGAFLLCARLGSRVPCRELFVDALKRSGIEGLEV